jgi:hypothetical protein
MKEKILNYLFWLVITLFVCLTIFFAIVTAVEPCNHESVMAEQAAAIVEQECYIVALQSIIAEKNKEIIEQYKAGWCWRTGLTSWNG